MPTKEIDLGYRARSQFVAFHQRKQRWACGVAHRRAGKTVACIMDLIDAALRCKKPDGRFAYIAPTFAQAKDTAWLYLKRYTANLPGVEQRESDLTVNLPNGARVKLYGADNYDRMRGIYLDGAVLDEYAMFDPRAYPEVIRPALADRQGWAVFIGTPNGHNDFWEVAEKARKNPEEWFFFDLKASQTGIVPDHELADLRRQLTADQYEQEMETSFEAAIIGAYYGKEMKDAQEEGRIGPVPYDKFIQVHTCWDLGVEDATSIWFFQRLGMEIRYVDYYEGSGVGLDHYVDVLEQRRRDFGFQWGEHLLPHDIQARELGALGAKSRLETLRGLMGSSASINVVPLHAVLDGINAVRRLLPRCWFDEKRCDRGLEALRQYRTEYDEKHKVFRRNPLHNWASHGADAFRTGAAWIDDTAAKRGVDRYHRKARPSGGSWMAA